MEPKENTLMYPAHVLNEFPPLILPGISLEFGYKKLVWKIYSYNPAKEINKNIITIPLFNNL